MPLHNMIFFFLKASPNQKDMEFLYTLQNEGFFILPVDFNCVPGSEDDE
jgi:hypothetical protein